MPHVFAPVPDVVPARASAAIYWRRTVRYFFCAKAGGAISVLKKDRLPSIHARCVLVLIFASLITILLSLSGQSGQVQMRGCFFWPPTGPTADKKIVQTLALQEEKFKNSFTFFCGLLRTILWRCVRACAFHLTGYLTSG